MKHFAAERLSWSRPDALTLLVVVMAVLGTVHILVRTSTHGAAIGGDSVTYLSTAANLIAGEGLQDFRGARLLPAPPLFPLVLAAIGLVGIEPLEAARWVNAAAYGLIILLSGLWLRRSLGSSFLVLGATLALMTSHPLSYFSSFILADSLFILFTLLALTQMEAFLNPSVARRSLMLVAVFTALAAVTRYAGIAGIVTGGLVLLLRRESPIVARLTGAAVYGVISSVPVGSVFVRNAVLFGDYDRKNTRIGQSLFESFDQTVRLFHEVLIPARAPGWLGTSLAWAFALAVPAGAAMYVYAAGRKRSAKSLGKRAGSSPFLARPFNVAGWQSVLPFAMFSFVYLTFIFLSMTWVASPAGIVARYYLPLYVPLFLLGAWLFDRFLRVRTHGWRAVAKRVSASLVLMACLGHFGAWARESLDLTAQGMESGFIGNTYNTAQWVESETIEYLRDHPSDARVFCNCYGLLHSVLALKTGTNVRGKYPTLPQTRHRLTELIETGRIEDGAYVVWLKSVKNPHYDYNDADLRTLPGVETVAERSDGVIFHVTRDALKSEHGTKNAI